MISWVLHRVHLTRTLSNRRCEKRQVNPLVSLCFLFIGAVVFGLRLFQFCCPCRLACRVRLLWFNFLLRRFHGFYSARSFAFSLSRGGRGLSLQRVEVYSNFESRLFGNQSKEGLD